MTGNAFPEAIRGSLILGFSDQSPWRTVKQHKLCLDESAFFSEHACSSQAPEFSLLAEKFMSFPLKRQPSLRSAASVRKLLLASGEREAARSLPAPLTAARCG